MHTYINIYIIYLYLSIYLSIYLYNITHSKCTKRWKQSSAIKKLLETLFFTKKMCTGFTKDMCSIYMNTICAVSLTNYLRAVADALRPLRTHQRNVYTAHIVFIYIMKKQQKFSFSKIILNFFFFMLI